MLLSDSLDIDAILKETAAVEKNLYATLAVTEKEKDLVHESRWVYLVGKLLDFALTKEEWEELKAIINLQAPNSQGISNRQSSKIQTLGFENLFFRESLGLENWRLTPFLSFYSEAESPRPRHVHANLEKVMSASHAKVAVLVTGGFHSEGMLRALQAQGVTVISYAPKISKIEDAAGSAYLTMFTQEKTPLDQLFAGEKLFLAGNPAQISHADQLADTTLEKRNRCGQFHTSSHDDRGRHQDDSQSRAAQFDEK